MFLGVANILEGQFSTVSRDTIEGAKNKIATVKGLNVLIHAVENFKGYLP